MLPLAGESAPSSSAQLAEALQRGLAQSSIAADVAASGDWPAVQSLGIQLSRIGRFTPVPRASAEPSISIGQLTITGTPVAIEGVNVVVQAEFAALQAGFAHIPEGQRQMVVNEAQSGRLHLEVEKADLEQAILRIVSELADKQGATVKSVKLDVTSLGPRSLQIEVACTAKVFIATATLSVVGRVDLDDQLNAQFSGLGVKGDGMIAGIAQTFIQPRLAEWNDRVIPLGDYVAAGLSVSDLKIAVNGRISLDATFAGSSRS